MAVKKRKLIKAITYKCKNLLPMLPEKEIPEDRHELVISSTGEHEPILNGVPLSQYDMDVVFAVTDLINNKYKSLVS